MTFWDTSAQELVSVSLSPSVCFLLASQSLSVGLSIWSPVHPLRLAMGGPCAQRPLHYYWWRGGGKAVSSPPLSILLVVGTERRVGGGSGQEAGGAAGAEPRAPGGRIVFLRGSAAGIGAPTRTQDSCNPTAPWSLNPSTIQTGRSSHLARTPNTDCELCAARSWGLPAALWISLTRIPEQVPWGRDVAAKRGRSAARGGQASECHGDPSVFSAPCA